MDKNKIQKNKNRLKDTDIPVNENYFFSQEDLPLFDSFQEFTAGSIWLEKGMHNHIATFDVYAREDLKRNFFVLGGLEEFIMNLKNLRYSEKQISFLLRHKIITKKYAKFLKNFKFTGDVYAMPEGSIFFPNEPVIRITAPLLQANVLTMFVINTIVSNSIFLTKAVRCVEAAKPKEMAGIYGLRAHSFESSMKASRASYIAGVKLNPLPSFYLKYGIKLKNLISTVVFHAFIKSFPSELEAMEAVASSNFGKQMFLMIDTYDFLQGLKNAIKIAKKLKRTKKSVAGIYVDSGDLLKNSKIARRSLDKAGLYDTKICVASNLNEYKIDELKKNGCPADIYQVVTEGTTVADSPKMEIVYKISQIENNGKVRYTSKFSPGKLSYPGKKQVFRIGKGDEARDIIGLEGEKLGKPLLRKIIKKGKLIYNLPSLNEINQYLQKNLNEIPNKLLDINKHHTFRVDISDNLNILLKTVMKRHGLRK